jgi:hypothetical protein
MNPDGMSLLDPTRRFLARAEDLLPVLLAVILVLAAGFVLAVALEWLVRMILQASRFDRLARRPPVADALLRAGFRHPPSVVAGRTARWIGMVVTLLAALSVLAAEVTDEVTMALIKYLPRLAAGLLVFVIGYGVSSFAARSVLLWAVNTGLEGARLLAGGVRTLIAVFFAALALEQLGFGRDIAVVVLSILLGGGVLAAALAFGLAGKDMARRILEQMTRRMHGDDEDTLSHL